MHGFASSIHMPTPSTTPQPALSEGITPEEVRLVSQVLLSGMEACALYWETEVKPEAQGVYYLMAEMLSGKWHCGGALW